MHSAALNKEYTDIIYTLPLFIESSFMRFWIYFNEMEEMKKL